jgi:hypothetical protein
MKHEWRKHETEIYIPKQTPTLVNIPKFKYITIKGQGNPNSEEFTHHIQALYPIAYAIKMMPKKGIVPVGYYEYTVYPLEGNWDLTEKGRKLETLDKNELVYTIMIRQPDFVTEDVFRKALEIAKAKNDSKLLDEVKLEEIEEGLCLQMLHIGSYDDEPITFALMNKYIKDNDLELVTKVHREIYLSDVRKVEPSKQKTVLRYRVNKK